jgi:hypothetical protein
LKQSTNIKPYAFAFNLIKSEYASFYKVMAREGMKLKMDRAASTAESKDSESGSRFECMHRGAKGGDDDDAGAGAGAKGEGKDSK